MNSSSIHSEAHEHSSALPNDSKTSLLAHHYYFSARMILCWFIWK